MNLKEMIAQALRAARAIAEKAKKESRDLTADEVKAFDAKMAEVDDLKVKLKQAEESDARFKALASLDLGDAVDEGRPAASLGDHFVKHIDGRSLKTRGTISVPEYKAATDTQVTGGSAGPYGPLLTDIDRSFVMPKRERLVVADLLQSGSVSGNALTYPVFGALEGGTATVGEAGKKPQLHIGDPTWKTDALSEVAGWFKMSDDMAEDLAYVASEINSTAIYDLALKEEFQLLNGDGTSPNLRGLLNRSGVQTHAKAADTVPDAIYKAIGKVNSATGFVADAIVINPEDYEPIRLSKDGNGQYFGGGFFQGAYGNGAILEEPPLWGRRTIVTTAIAKGVVLTGAFRTAKVFRKGGIRVESTNSHEDDFTNDKITVRVRERLGLQVKYPAAFVKITIGE